MSPSGISPSRILKDLDELWRTLSKGENGEPSTAVLRACAMTLIVVTSDPDEEFGETLAHLMRDHPSRLIVVRLTAGALPLLDAGVTAQCWMPFGKRQQICCEQIVVTSSRASLPEAPALIRALIVADLPVVCWVRGNEIHRWPEFTGMIGLVDKLIVDSAEATAYSSQGQFIRHWDEGPRRVSDLAWTRLTRWREAIAQVFDDPGCAGRAAEIERVRIAFEGPYLPIAAYYLAAWLRNSLGRPLEFIFPCAGPGERARVHTVALSGGSVNYSITVTSNREMQLQGAARDAHSVLLLRSDYELLREELSILGPDPVYEAVMRRMPDFTDGAEE